jgi:hypothetical protein
MARNRIIYQSEAIFVSDDISSTGLNAHNNINRVQSANYGFTINRQDINQYGQLSRLDSIAIESPLVSLDLSYYLTDGFNEQFLNLQTDPGIGFLSGQMATSSGQNFYIITTPEGKDAASGNYSNFDVISIGNAFLTDYSVNFGVGQIPIVNASFEASNASSQIQLTRQSDFFSGIENASVDPVTNTKNTNEIRLPVSINKHSPTSAISPKDVVITISNSSGITNLSTNESGAHIQTASISIPIARSPLQRLGTTIPYARAINFPLNVDFSLNAVLNEVNQKNLSTVLDNPQEFSINISCGNGSSTLCKYNISGAKLVSESFSSAVGSNKVVDLSFSAQVGGPADIRNNIFFSGDLIQSLITEDGNFLTTEAGEILILE